ncbi:MAG: class I SAM-dependent methyltransferase [Parashewanella sp.]
MNQTLCALCHSTELTFYVEDKKRQYWQCETCHLVQVPSSFHLTSEQEKAEYDKHDNNCDDVGYRRFLSRCLDPVLQRIPVSAKGLDFGCGEGKVLSKMAAEKGMSIDNYDLYYVNQPQLLIKRYDVITMTEVIEHIADANALLIQLQSMLNKNGLLAVMTKRVKDKSAFKQWHYKNDQTHICFYSIATFEWIAQRFQWQLEVISDDVVMFTT